MPKKTRSTSSAEYRIGRLHLRNVRSWASVDIGFSSGVNVIVGESDCGKSNLVRAIRAIVENESAKVFVRAGEDAGDAELEFHLLDPETKIVESLSIELAKSETVNRYRYSTVHEDAPTKDTRAVFDSVGSGVPEEIARVNPLSPIIIDGEAINLHIAGQRDAAFFIDETPSRLAKILSTVSGVGKVLAASGEAKRLANTARAEAKSMKLVIESLDSQMAAVPDVETLRAAEAKRRAAIEILAGTKDKESRAAAIREAADELRDRSREVIALKRRAACGESLDKAGTLLRRAIEMENEADTIEAAMSAVSEARKEWEQMTHSLDEASAAVSWSEAELASALKKAGVCPLCKQEIADE